MKNTKTTKKLFSMVLCMVLIVAMALFTTGCTEKPDTQPDSQPSQTTDIAYIGQGQTAFTFIVADKGGVETTFEVHTDETTVGGALLACGLIQGEEGPYGLYVKTVNGITADYDVDGTYWAFYVNGQYATSGVDTTDINTADTYTFKVEK